MLRLSEQRARERWLVISNCQTHGFANSLQALAPDVEVVPLYPHTFNRRPRTFNRRLEGFDRLFISPGVERLMTKAKLERIPQHVYLPWFGFRAYHPDLVYVEAQGERLKSPADDYHSGIVLAAYLRGMSIADTRALFTMKTFESCQMLGWWDAERSRIIAHCAEIGLDIAPLIAGWGRREAFMYSNNHPKVRVLFDIAKLLVRATGCEPLEGATLPHDNLAMASGFAVYPEIGETLGVSGAYLFKTYDTYRQFGLTEFITGCFDIYAQHPRDTLAVAAEFEEDFARTKAAI